VSRVLLLLPTGTYRAADFIAAAGALGAQVVVASEHQQALAGAMGDRSIALPFDRPDDAAAAVIELHRRTPLDAVVAVDDVGLITAVLACRELGLPHNPPEAVTMTRDKAAMRRALAAAGVAQPEFAVATGDDDAGRAAAAEVGFPAVVKPVSLSGSRGVIRVDDANAASLMAKRVRVILADAGEDPDGPLLVERFVAGDEVALEGLLRAGRLETLALFDKPDPLDGPYFEETIYVTPSGLDGAAQARIEKTVAAAAAAIGLREGPVHAELRLPPGGAPIVIEIAARSIGGLCSRSLRFGAGASLEELILRHALGLPLDDGATTRERAASGVMMLPIPDTGVLRAVHGQDDARATPGVDGLEITVAAGRRVRALPEGDRYLGFLFARGDTPGAVEAALRAAHGRLTVVIDDP